jgi:hypothetical protein
MNQVDGDPITPRAARRARIFTAHFDCDLCTTERVRHTPTTCTLC